MSSFARLIRFESPEGKIYFADLGLDRSLPLNGSRINAFASLNDLITKKGATDVYFKKAFISLSVRYS
jgi:hypothetical protein